MPLPRRMTSSPIVSFIMTLFNARLGMPGRFLGIDSGIHFFSGQVAVLILIAGLLLGFIGSAVSVLDLGRAKS